MTKLRNHEDDGSRTLRRRLTGFKALVGLAVVGVLVTLVVLVLEVRANTEATQASPQVIGA